MTGVPCIICGQRGGASLTPFPKLARALRAQGVALQHNSSVLIHADSCLEEAALRLVPAPRTVHVLMTNDVPVAVYENDLTAEAIRQLVTRPNGAYDWNRTPLYAHVHDVMLNPTLQQLAGPCPWVKETPSEEPPAKG